LIEDQDGQRQQQANPADIASLTNASMLATDSADARGKILAIATAI
jgi:hypothetical protein